MGLARFLYFTVYFVIGAQMPYLPLFLDEIGFSTTQIGALIGAQSFSILLTPIVFAHFADTTSQSIRTLFLVSFTLTATMATALCFQQHFWPALLIALSYGMFLYPLFSLLDGLALSLVSSQETALVGGSHPGGAFSKVRFWGTVGFLTPSILLAPFEAAFNLSASVPLLTGAGMAAFAALAIGTGLISFPPGLAPPKRDSIPLLEAVKAGLRPPIIWVLLTNFLSGLAMASYYGFFPLRLQQIGAPAYSIGLIYNIGVVIEAALLWHGPSLMARFGVARLFLWGTIACLARFATLFLSDSLWVVSLSQVLHAPIILAVAVMSGTLLNTLGQDRYRYSLLSLNQLISFGLARLIGNMLIPNFTSHLTEIFLWSVGFSLLAVYCAEKVRGAEATLSGAPASRLTTNEIPNTQSETPR
jgi:PPP family 3-phenylpropionic acid transporter